MAGQQVLALWIEVRALAPQPIIFVSSGVLPDPSLTSPLDAGEFIR